MVREATYDEIDGMFFKANAAALQKEGIAANSHLIAQSDKKLFKSMYGCVEELCKESSLRIGKRPFTQKTFAELLKTFNTKQAEHRGE